MSMPRAASKMHPVTAVTIAASDSSGGAGIQADLAVFAAHGVHGASVLTAVTAQSTRGIRSAETLSPAFVRRQMDAVFPDLHPGAVKLGALGGAAVVRAVARGLQRHRRFAGNVVLDPVLASKGGWPLLEPRALPILLRDIFPLCAVVTPNLPEAEVLSGVRIQDESDRRLAAEVLADRGAAAVLIKGGHGPGRRRVVDDLLFDGRRFASYEHARVAGTPLHGTGCALSSAIAANLALGATLHDAVEGAIAYVERAIEEGIRPGRGRGVLAFFPTTKAKATAVTPRTGTGRRDRRRRRPKAR